MALEPTIMVCIDPAMVLKLKDVHRDVFTDLHLNGDCFHASVSSKLEKDQIFKLFDIAPGLRNIQIVSQNVSVTSNHETKSNYF